MNAEYKLINQILKNFKRSVFHGNEFFSSDSEIIELAGKKYLITVDGYSDEDHFRIDDPLRLGKNLTACTLSDIFACGGRPVFFCNSLTAAHSWNDEYVNNLAKGIAEVLNECGAGFIGGDMGFCDRWNFTGIAIGESEKIVTREGAEPGSSIYITGKIGSGNFEAASRLLEGGKGLEELFPNNPVSFPVRMKEAGLVSKFAKCCIDTSDGLFRSLKILSEINNTGFIINNIPWYGPAMDLTKILKLPVEILIFGESGEYELLFAVDEEKEKEMLKEAEALKINITKIGEITEYKHQLIKTKNREISTEDFDIWARDYCDHLVYIKALTDYIKIKIET